MKNIKKLTVKINTTYKYLQLWNGIFNLTEKELKILSSFIDVSLEVKLDNLCGVESKKRVAKSLGLKDPNTLNNYVKRFKDKGVIKKIDTNYKLLPLLNPDATGIEINISR